MCKYKTEHVLRTCKQKDCHLRPQKQNPLTLCMATLHNPIHEVIWLCSGSYAEQPIYTLVFLSERTWHERRGLCCLHLNENIDLQPLKTYDL